MALLNFKGKSSIWNHHLSIPYQTLEKDKKLSLKGKNEDENLIIEADNLIALKSLLPKYQGKIRCIYIDPPYNTGNEGWVYNDSVNSPLIRDWIGQAVGGDDLTRHDKWLCMMVPRLNLLRELLSDDGIIFISIDDNEISHLKNLMDEIFGEDNFIANFIRQSIKGGTGPTDEIRKTHDYILVFAKSKKDCELSGLEIDSESLDLIDKKGHYRKGRELNKWGAGSRREDSPSMWFPIKGPANQNIYPIRNDGTEGRWRWGKKKLLKAVEENEVIFEPRKNNTFIVYEKIRDDNPRRKSFSTLDLPNADGTKSLKDLFNDKTPFDYPKPPELIKFIMSLCANEDGDIILDSFAGSGTTAEAVLSMDDGVERNFILVQISEKLKKDSVAFKMGYKFVHEITRERIKRVIDKEKLGVGFTYMKLGPKIDAESILAGQLPSYKELAKYIYFLATGKTMDDDKNINEEDYFVGKVAGQSIYLLYKKDFDKLKNMAVTLEWAEKINKKDKNKKIVYAPACFLDDENLEKFNIQFVGIPYSLFGKK